MIKKRIVWFVFLLLLFVCSYSREVLFRSINAMIAGETVFYAKTTAIDFLSNYSSRELYQLKYILTVAYSLIFICLTAFGLRLSFSSKLSFILSIGIYALLALTAVLSIVIALTLGKFSNFYPFLRELVGLIHNPLLFIILSIGHIALAKSRQ